jgi:hypothetical protein
MGGKYSLTAQLKMFQNAPLSRLFLSASRQTSGSAETSVSGRRRFFHAGSLYKNK